MDEARAIDLRKTCPAETRRKLEDVASELRGLWAEAIERADFAEVARLVDASHAVHRAVIALSADAVACGWVGEHPTEVKHVLHAAASSPPP
jgi:hypothetical protein